MHEASLIENMLQIAESYLAEYKVAKVNSLTLCMGPFSGAMSDALYAAFEAADRELFRGAELKIRHTQAEVCCTQCGNIDSISSFPYRCSRCGGQSMQLLSGQELYLESVDFEEGGD